MSFAEHLMRLRKSRGLSQEELGHAIQVTRQTVSKWETGETTPDLDRLLALSAFFEISLDELTDNDTAAQTHTDARSADTPPGGRPSRFSYTFTSRRTIRGIPWVHIHLGFGLCRARGILAIGNVAQGVVAIGGVAMGLFSVGGLAVGMVSFAGLALALLCAVGGLAVGTIAIGGCAIGVLAIGGLAVGIYAVGGCAIGDKLARGGYARAQIAIGQRASGNTVFLTADAPSPSVIRAAILRAFPSLPEWLLSLFADWPLS